MSHTLYYYTVDLAGDMTTFYFFRLRNYHKWKYSVSKVNNIIKIGGVNFACVESPWKFNEVWGGHNWGELFTVFFLLMFQSI